VERPAAPKGALVEARKEEVARDFSSERARSVGEVIRAASASAAYSRRALLARQRELEEWPGRAA